MTKVKLYYKNNRHVSWGTNKPYEQCREFNNMKQLGKWLAQYGMFIHSTRIEKVEK